MKGRHPYYLTDKGKKLAEKEFQKRKLKQQIDDLSEERLKSLFDFVNKILMKAVRLTIDNTLLELTFERYRDGTIPKDKINDFLEANAKISRELKSRDFFTEEEIEKMVLSTMFTKDIQSLTKARMDWFVKWFGE
jgi:hypothetical protein